MRAESASSRQQCDGLERGTNDRQRGRVRAGVLCSAGALAVSAVAAVILGASRTAESKHDARGEAALASIVPATATPAAVQQAPASATAEQRLRVELLDNGSFMEPNARAVDRDGILRIPWWRSSRGMPQVVELDADLSPRVVPRDELKERAFAFAAQTRGADFVEQPVAAYAPYARSLVVRGKLRGHGRVTITDGSGGVARFDFGPSAQWTKFEITGDAIVAQYGREPMPRFVVRFEGVRADETALWRELSASAELPCPSEAALRAELHDVLAWIFAENIERGFDAVGPVRTGYWAHDFDAVTGERIQTLPSSQYFQLFDHLRIAVAAGGDAAWSTALDTFCTHFFAHGLHPDTGLPRPWDCTNDVALDDRPTEIGIALGFLIDLAESGHEKWSSTARAAALKMGETILARGLLPDGSVAASYFPANGRVNTNVAQLRRLDVPAQLARLYGWTRDARYEAAIREALAAFEYSQLWSGTWQQIDPAFDDEFGHYGARSILGWKSVPDYALLRGVALGGWKHFAPLWRDAVRLGGNCAADQVRCWVMMLDVALLEPKEAAQIRELVRAALRGHFKGEQSVFGAWQDLTVIDFETQSTFAEKVGDHPGVPQNLLHGLAAIYGTQTGMRTDEVRAMYAAVLRSSIEAYKRPHGFLIELPQRNGPNSAIGSFKLLLGIVKMYAALPR